MIEKNQQHTVSLMKSFGCINVELWIKAKKHWASIDFICDNSGYGNRQMRMCLKLMPWVDDNSCGALNCRCKNGWVKCRSN